MRTVRRMFFSSSTMSTVVGMAVPPGYYKCGTLKGSRTPALWLRRAKPASATATNADPQGPQAARGRRQTVSPV